MHEIHSVTPSAVLDDAHQGAIQGALGSVQDPLDGRRSVWQRIQTLLAILGPGLIVMVGDNDAGAFSTYAQAGQNYGISLLWTLVLLIPVLYVNQEMVLRLGVVTGVGHARLIFERFGKFWGAFSVIDLFLLNALTLVTEFVGIVMGLHYLGLPKVPGVLVSMLVLLGAVSTGSFRRFERFALTLVVGSLLLVPLFVLVHPPLTAMAQHMLVPGFPKGSLSDIMLLIIAIVGTTVAPWQLFFQQSYIIDKRITPRYMNYERIDLWLGIGVVIIGAAAMVGFTAQTFQGHPEFGHFQDSYQVAVGLGHYVGRAAGILFALALIDACIIGAAAVSLASAYALGDVFSMRHSLHRKPSEAKGFYVFYACLITLAAALVLTPGVPLGLLTNLVQTLAGVLLPSATVFLLLLCNDRQVLGPWINTPATNVFTTVVIALLVILSMILTLSVLVPDLTGWQMLAVLAVCLAVAAAVTMLARGWDRRHVTAETGLLVEPVQDRSTWRMPQLHHLLPPRLSMLDRSWLAILRIYLVVAAGMVVVKLVHMAFAHS